MVQYKKNYGQIIDASTSKKKIIEAITLSSLGLIVSQLKKRMKN